MYRWSCQWRRQRTRSQRLPLHPHRPKMMAVSNGDFSYSSTNDSDREHTTVLVTGLAGHVEKAEVEAYFVEVSFDVREFRLLIVDRSRS